MALLDAQDKRVNFHIGVNVVVIRDNKLLLGKRGNISGKGEWALPGGHLEFQESIVSAATRELLEETGMHATDFRLVNLANVPQSDKHYLQIAVIAQDVQGEPEIKEPERCEAWQWFNFDRLPEPLFFGHKTQIQGIVQDRLLSDTDTQVN